MKRLLAAILFLLCSTGGASALVCPSPNPNISAPPFVDGCPLPASGLNNLATSIANLSAIVATKGNVIVTDARFGAKCDGTTNDSAAFTAAMNSFGGTGGTVYVPATGHSCVLNSGITLPANVVLTGVAGGIGTGYTNFALTDWTKSGSWVQCADLTNPCLTINGTGSAVLSLNFIYNQPPVGTGWHPTLYPYTILVTSPANGWAIDRVSITAADKCIDLEGPANGIAGIQTQLTNVWFNGCFDAGTRFHNIDNTLYMANLRYYPYWNLSAPVISYMETHKIDWDVNYLANAQANGVEFGLSYRSIQLTNSTVTSGFGPITFAAGNLQLTNISFNEVCAGIAMPNGNGTAASMALTNVLAYADTSTSTATACAGLQPNFFDLSSDQAAASFSHVQAGFVQTLMAVRGTVRLSDIDVQKYSAFATGGTAFKVAAGSSFTLAGTAYRNIRPAAGAGNVLGPGLDSTQGYEEMQQVGVCLNQGTTIDGCVSLMPGGVGTVTGSVDFFLPNGTRTGFVGRNLNTEMNIESDAGGINLLPVNGANLMSVNSVGGKLIVNVVGLPTSCSGQPTGTIWNNAGALGVCP
jgi:hypothetical protein